MLENYRLKLKTFTILMRAHQAIEAYVKKDIAQYDLNLNEFAVIEALFYKGRMPVQGMCQQVLIPASSMTYVLDKLAEKDYIIRIQDDQDKRTFYVELTEKGSHFVERVFPKHYDYLMAVFGVLSEAEQKTLNELLKRIGYLAMEKSHLK